MQRNDHHHTHHPSFFTPHSSKKHWVGSQLGSQSIFGWVCPPLTRIVTNDMTHFTWHHTNANKPSSFRVWCLLLSAGHVNIRELRKDNSSLDREKQDGANTPYVCVNFESFESNLFSEILNSVFNIRSGLKRQHFDFGLKTNDFNPPLFYKMFREALQIKTRLLNSPSKTTENILHRYCTC
jgi:hypothetical protein